LTFSNENFSFIPLALTTKEEDMSIYKKQLPIAIAALLCSNQLLANMIHQQGSNDERLCALERHNAELGRVSPAGNQRNDFFFTADYLLWHFNECGLGYAVELNNTTANAGKVQNVNFDWSSGVRLGIGYRIPHDMWELSATWTGITSHAKGKTSSSGQLIEPIWTHAVIASPASLITSMSGKWGLHLNILDGEMGRYFMATRWLALKPHFGLRGAWIDQSYSTTSTGGATFRGTAVGSDTVKIKNDFKGVGLRAGLDTEWGFARRWSFYGNAAYSLVYGLFSLKQSESMTVGGSPSSIKDIKDSFQQLVSIAELGLGLRWDLPYCHKKMGFRLQAGWEFNAYFGQNKFERFGLPSAPGLSFNASNDDLTVQGFVLSARFDF
jgi:hypothetical protein